MGYSIELIKDPTHPNSKIDDKATKIETNIENQKIKKILQKIKAQKTLEPNLSLTNLKNSENQILTYKEAYSLADYLKSQIQVLNRKIDEEELKKGNNLSKFEIKILDFVESLMDFPLVPRPILKKDDQNQFSPNEGIKLRELKARLNVEKQDIASAIKKWFNLIFEYRELSTRQTQMKIFQHTFFQIIDAVDHEDLEAEEGRDVERMKQNLEAIHPRESNTGDSSVFLPGSSITVGGT
ncbi:hypothetical protein CROQUDRAFT_156695 [Cronartium quercuum f. sp. fusiforme G11]|uniref:Uncharacterized protein n=1 Tax=Cronartium quercuum f. sp. fusiforme G11 TaxID=708437 RepID=A0A9P6NRR8_9BASI|nr:hypothetical protein CROQUDRAFT_156695 [Cronartium quercuum f. sp. fusiforme G11]